MERSRTTRRDANGRSLGEPLVGNETKIGTAWRCPRRRRERDRDRLSGLRVFEVDEARLKRPWLGAMFDYFESHPAVKAISYFNYNNREGASHVKWDPSRDVFLYNGHVRYTPDVNDHDHRLLAGGPEIRAIFARRIASGRYLLTVSTETADSEVLPPTAALLKPTLRGLTATVRWQGNLAADTYDLAIKPRLRAWRIVAKHLTATSYRLKGEAGDRVLVRVRPRDVFGSPGSWSASRSFAFPRQ